MVARPLKNRVDPSGRLHAVSKRLCLMGNRGRLHNADKVISMDLPWDGHRWIVCKLDYNGTKPREGKVFGDSYSELFFLDEASALSAGHRPCAVCQRSRYNGFKAAWLAANAQAGLGMKPPIEQIDDHLHTERVSEHGTKRTYSVSPSQLPPGTFVEIDGAAYVIWDNVLWRWTFDGYVHGPSLVQAPAIVNVLTPRSIVNMFAARFKPRVHRTLPRSIDTCD